MWQTTMRNSLIWSEIMQTLLGPSALAGRQRFWPWRVLVATTAAVAPFVFRQFLASQFQLFLPPFLMFSPIILLVALACGFGTGLLTTALVGLLAQIWIILPDRQRSSVYGSDTMALVFFCVIGFLLSMFAKYFRERLFRMAMLEREQEIIENRDRFYALLRDSRDIIFRYNLRTSRYEYVSSAVQSVLGYSQEELQNLTFEASVAAVHPDDRALFLSEVQAVEGQGRREFEFRMMARDGRYRWLSNIITCFYDEQGRPLCREGFLRDITEKKQAEDALLRNATLASVGRMVAAIAHEINNPLAAVTNLLFLAALDPDLPAPVRRYLEQADAELQRIAHITRQTLGFYREVNAPAPVCIDALISSAIHLFQRRMERDHVSLVREWREDLQVVGVAGELRQVFSNLLANSLDAVEENGTIRLRAGTRLRDGLPYMRILVSDNGRGIAHEVREHIFEPFFTTKGAVGTGLGLWVTQQLIDKHGGTIRLRSKTEGAYRGTLFVIDLPLEQPVAAARIAVEGELASTA